MPHVGRQVMAEGGDVELLEQQPFDPAHIFKFAAGGVVPELRPAIRHRGKVYAATKGTHLDAIQMVPDADRSAAMEDGNNRGYVTPTGRFLNRFAAQNYAVDRGLLKKNAPEWAKTSPELIAENLQLKTGGSVDNALALARSTTMKGKRHV
jgi:hypothetical protein